MKGYSTYSLLLLCITTAVVYGQSITPHILCVQQQVSVTPGSSGVIEYVHRESSSSLINCTMSLRGFTHRSHLSVPGLERKLAEDECPHNPGVTVLLNDISYCISEQFSCNQAMVSMDTDEVKVTLSLSTAHDLSVGSMFSIDYYNTVSLCHESVEIPDKPSIYQLSGVFTTSYNPSESMTNEECDITITNLPSLTGAVRYTIPHAYPTFSGGEGMICSKVVGIEDGSNGENKGSVDRPKDLVGSLVVIYTVLRCGDVPAVKNAIVKAPIIPYTPASIATYNCAANYMFKSENVSSIQCQVDRMKYIAEWSDHSLIKCVPVPRCVSSPFQVEGATYRLGGDNLTATYQCIDGYTTNGSVSDRTINCTTSDRDTTPWTWTSANFLCTPAVCPAPPILTNTIMQFTDERLNNSRVMYSCADDYLRINGDWELVCVIADNKAFWKGKQLNCPLVLSQGFILTSVAVGLSIAMSTVVVASCTVRLRRKRTHRKLSTMAAVENFTNMVRLQNAALSSSLPLSSNTIPTSINSPTNLAATSTHINSPTNLAATPTYINSPTNPAAKPTYINSPTSPATTPTYINTPASAAAENGYADMGQRRSIHEYETMR